MIRRTETRDKTNQSLCTNSTKKLQTSIKFNNIYFISDITIYVLVIGTWLMEFRKKNWEVVCDAFYDVYVSVNNKKRLGTRIYLFV